MSLSLSASQALEQVPCLHALMHLHVVFFGEPLAAMAAFKRSDEKVVRLNMFCEVASLGETRKTLVALEGLLFAVRPVMVEELGEAAVELLLAVSEAARKDLAVTLFRLWFHEVQNIIIRYGRHGTQVTMADGVEICTAYYFHKPPPLDMEEAREVREELIWYCLADASEVGRLWKAFNLMVEDTIVDVQIRFNFRRRSTYKFRIVLIVILAFGALQTNEAISY